jgi:site-specific DNA-methyltransferase (adenine-specific)
MEKNTIYQGSCFDLMDMLDENSIDLIVTSPPYADIKSYGKKVNEESVFHVDHYVDWILPLFDKMFRVLKPSGSLIFNIDDKCHKKLRHFYIFDLISRISMESQMKMYDYYIWHKKACLPSSSPKRLNHMTEFIFHFVKNENLTKWNMDNVREEYAASSVNRCKTDIKSYTTNEDGVKTGTPSKNKLNGKGKVPSNVFRFNNNQVERGNKHPAPFNKEIPIWFIKALTNDGDLILDPFMGSGTTAMASIEMNRDWIGFELNQVYIDMAAERIGNITKESNTSYVDFF